MQGLKVITYDVEHGSSHVIITPSNQVVMIDAGSKEEFSPALHLRYNWKYQNPRWLTITHHDSDHLTDIKNIDEHFPPLTLEQPNLTREQLLNLYDGAISQHLEDYLSMKRRYIIPAPPMSDESYNWGSVQFAVFKNELHDLENPQVNDMSVVTFAQYQAWTFIFPGDLEKQGWKKLLENEAFRGWLSKTDIFIASHHGRESGYCPEVFEYCKPHIVVISDKSISDTSCTDLYYNVSKGLNVHNPLDEKIMRSVLTTRKDGAITIDISTEGKYWIKTSQ